MFLLRQLYLSSGKLGSHIASETVPCSKAWRCPSEAALGQRGAVLVIQSRTPREKACISGINVTHILLLKFADKQKWEHRAGAAALPRPKPITSVLQKDTDMSWGGKGWAWPTLSAGKSNVKQGRRERKMRTAFETSKPFFFCTKRVGKRQRFLFWSCYREKKINPQTHFEAFGSTESTETLPWAWYGDGRGLRATLEDFWTRIRTQLFNSLLGRLVSDAHVV